MTVAAFTICFLFLSSALRYEDASARSAAVVDVAAVALSQEEPVCAACWSCCPLDPQGCHAVDSYESGPWQGEHSCLSITCGPHPECNPEGGGGEGGLSEQAWTAALLGDYDRLIPLLREWPEIVTFNKERGAVQIRQCGTLIANIPVRQGVAGYLTAE